MKFKIIYFELNETPHKAINFIHEFKKKKLKKQLEVIKE